MREGFRTLALRVNGEPRSVVAPGHHTLLEVLREECALTGTKHGCELGECGACAVLIDGELVLSCLVAAVECEARQVTTQLPVGRSTRSETWTTGMRAGRTIIVPRAPICRAAGGPSCASGGGPLGSAARQPAAVSHPAQTTPAGSVTNRRAAGSGVQATAPRKMAASLTTTMARPPLTGLP